MMTTCWLPECKVDGTWYWWLDQGDLSTPAHLPGAIFSALQPDWTAGQITGHPGAGYRNAADAINDLRRVLGVSKPPDDVAEPGTVAVVAIATVFVLVVLATVFHYLSQWGG